MKLSVWQNPKLWQGYFFGINAAGFAGMTFITFVALQEIKRLSGFRVCLKISAMK
ncbi:MAG: hypothetical protein QME16_00190 [Planctomycetota bacterium]|nr:hypothetical protein [Planctomycetota bacterium]